MLITTQNQKKMLSQLTKTLELFGFSTKWANFVTIFTTLFVLGWMARGVATKANDVVDYLVTAQKNYEYSIALSHLQLQYSLSISEAVESTGDELLTAIENTGNKALAEKIRKDLTVTYSTLPHHTFPADTAKINKKLKIGIKPMKERNKPPDNN